MKACKPIPEAQEITISYMPLITGEPIRSQHIKDEWNFECQCQRCSENDNPLNELRCQNCKSGKVIYQKIHLPFSWHCQSCKSDFSAEDVKLLINEVQDELR